MEPNKTENNAEDAATQKTLTLTKKDISEDFASDAEALKKAVIGDTPVAVAAPGEAAAESELDGLTSEAIAEMGVVAVTEIVSAQYPFIQYPEEVKSKAVSKLVPVLNKYNIKSEFLDKWKAEVECAFFFGTIIFSTWRQIAEYKKANAPVPEKQTTQAGAVDVTQN